MFAAKYHMIVSFDCTELCFRLRNFYSIKIYSLQIHHLPILHFIGTQAFEAKILMLHSQINGCLGT